MLDEFIEEMENFPNRVEFTMQVNLDDKGYYDRLCPKRECGGAFKVLFDDWRDKVREEKVFCPFCRHEAESTQWHTPAQREHIETAAVAKATEMLNEALGRASDRSRPERIDAGLFNLTISSSYTPKDIPEVIPATATAELRQEFKCEVCGCRYASLGASFFCPACGHNSAKSCFDSTLETVRKTVHAVEVLRSTLEATADADTARDATRQLLEDQFGRLVGAFERLNEALFDSHPNAGQAQKKGNVFQRIGDGSQLWQQVSGKCYNDFLDSSEIERLKLLFQRRHILSHKQGFVDQAYIDKSQDNSYGIGQRLIVRDADVLELVDLIAKLASGLRSLV